MSSNWALRRAALGEFECENCDLTIRLDSVYFKMQDGRRFCCECPPDELGEGIKACQ